MQEYTWTAAYAGLADGKLHIIHPQFVPRIRI